MKEILLTRNRYAIVDDEDYSKLSKHSWHYTKNGYAYSRVNYKLTSMHRFILNEIPNGLYVDHINGNKLDNRKENLRICSKSQNGMNSKKQGNRSSIYKGVSFCKRKNRWRSFINKEGKRYHLGRFDNEKEAAIAYNNKAKELFGNFASLNEVP